MPITRAIIDLNTISTEIARQQRAIGEKLLVAAEKENSTLHDP